MLRTIAIDWSGDRRNSRRKIWVAEAADGQLIDLRCGWKREELVDWLVNQAAATPAMIVGLDFAFSFPAWFVVQHDSARGLWAHAANQGEDWLRSCEPPFWGRPGRPRPTVPAALRLTDLDVPGVGGIRPKSPFQIGGAGAVGTGSVRGMAALHRLSQADFSVWPFDEPRLPLLIEIYPRVLTGPVTKSDHAARCSYLQQHCPQLTPDLRGRAESSEDAFDAAVSALVMDAHRHQLVRSLPDATDARRLEGEIWCPGNAVTRRPDVADGAPS